jgi:hypothetical protein
MNRYAAFFSTARITEKIDPTGIFSLAAILRPDNPRFINFATLARRLSSVRGRSLCNSGLSCRLLDRLPVHCPFEIQRIAESRAPDGGSGGGALVFASPMPL